jgi:arylsulfatase A-like enzyme
MSRKKPDVLLIILDTLRRDRLSVYGHNRPTSPELDDFSTGATLFERAIAPAQWTVPSHGSIFTGLYPSTHRLIEGDGYLSESYPTLAEILRGEGYHTVGFCNNPLVGVLDNGLQRGFEAFYNYAGASVNRPLDMTRHPVRRALSQSFHRFARVTSQRFARSETLFRVSLNPLLTPIWTRFINYKGHTPNSIDDLIAYWKSFHAGGTDRPLFAFLNLMGSHLPYRPPQDALDRVVPELRRHKRSDSDSRRAFRFMSRFNADAGAWGSPPDPPLEDWQHQTLSDFYDAEIAAQDVHLGRLLKMLRESGALEDTLIIIAADHGEGHGDHRFFGHSFVVYQELVHVPLIVHAPERFPKGKRVMTNVSTRRIFHTVLDYTGIRPPLDEADPNANTSALTLARATNGAPDVEGGLAFAEAFPPSLFIHVLEHRNPAAIERLRLRQVRRGVYDGANKLTVVGSSVEGLYDVSQDPAETRDLAAERPAVVSELQGKISRFVQTAEERRADGGGSPGTGVSDEVVDHLRALGYFE